MKRTVLLLLLGIGLITPYAGAQADRMAVLVATNPVILHIDDNTTQNIRFIQWEGGLELTGTTIDEKASNFFIDYGIAFGIKNPANTFLIEQTQIDNAGNTHLKIQQFYEGLPFFGGQIQLHFNSRKQLKVLNGVIFSDPTIDAIPQVSYFDAISSAMRFMDKTFPNEDLNTLDVQEIGLEFYHHGLAMHQLGEQSLVYALVISNKNNIREHIFVDALTGQTIAHFPANCSLLHRRLFLQSKNNQIWNEGEITDVLDNYQEIQIQSTLETYYFFSKTFQYHSFNNLDAEMQIIDQVTFLNCPNASWNGSTTNFCAEVSTDDIVAHEWGHAYTEYTSELLYAWQAGAINEAYSDIWGETIDLLNGDQNQDAPRTDCDNNVRWKIGEDATSFDEPIRDMWNPNCNNDPGRISDTTYHCLTEDYGGVHTNSGIVNHAYALLVDGGQYNGFNINGIGLTKAAHIFWHAQRYYLTRTSDFAALADALEAACLDLTNVDLDRLCIADETNTLSGQSINSFDSLQLHNVLLAVEMRMPADQCDVFSSALITPTPALCLEEGVGFDPFFTETFEEGDDAWTINQILGMPSTWDDRKWILTNQLPDNRPGKAMYGPTPNVGNCNLDQDYGLLRLQSPVILVPNNIESSVYLTFDHYFSFENRKDGGNLKVQRNGNNWMNIPPSAFVHNGYNQYLDGLDNPLSNQKAFTGANQGSVTGNWGTTQIELSILGVRAGDELIIRWEVGTDGCDGWDGWYIDDISLATCSAAAALPVNYLYFNAKQQTNEVQLNWKTSLEVDNKGFNIERSFDGQHFNTIGWVSSKNEHSYEFTDRQIAGHQRIYYRLRQEDFDGKTSFSDIRLVHLDSESEWLIYPNPARGQISIQLSNNTIFPLTISVRSIDGRLLKQPAYFNNNEFVSIPLDGLTSGLYLVQMQNKDGVSYKHLVID